MRERAYRRPGNARAELARLGVNLDRVDVVQREAHRLDRGDGRRERRKPEEHRDVDGFARVQVADADLVADARRELVVVEEGVHLLDLRAAERLHAQPHALRRDRPGAAANERRTDAPAEAAALERADGVERGGG